MCFTPNVQISDVDAPDEVLTGAQFIVGIEMRYVAWPWWLGGKPITIFSNFRKNGNVINEIDEFPFKPSWFSGKIKHSYYVMNYDEESIFEVEVGYNE